LGVRTDTLDTEGEVIAREEPHVTREQAEQALRSLVGRRVQLPPLYSAVKFHGRPLYDWTRKGVAVEQIPREVEIFSIRIDEVSLPQVTFTVSCSKGTYIRSLCSEVGEALGCGGCMSALRRLRSGCFSEEMALATDGMTEEEKRVLFTARLAPMAKVLPGFACIDVDPGMAEKLRNGHQPDGETLTRYHIPFLAAGDVVKFTTGQEHLVAVARMLRASDELASVEDRKQAVRILRVFN
jgi:tRNA pseudouridine55 synthase